MNMQMETAGKLIARGAACVLAGGGMAFLTEWTLNHASYSEAQQIAGIEACAKDLGSTAITVDVMPGVCYQDSPQFIPYHYTQSDNLEYNLPSAKGLRAEEQGVPAEVQEQGDNIDKDSEIVGTLGTVSLSVHLAYLTD